MVQGLELWPSLLNWYFFRKSNFIHFTKHLFEKVHFYQFSTMLKSWWLIRREFMRPVNSWHLQNKFPFLNILESSDKFHNLFFFAPSFSYTKMEAQDRQLLEDHRAMFRQSVEVEQLLPFLLAGEAITTMDITSINAHVSRERKVKDLLTM